MKKFISQLFIMITIFLSTTAQKRIYITVDGGVPLPFISHQIAKAITANGFGDNYTYGTFWGFDETSHNPDESYSKLNFKLRLGYRVGEKNFIEAGYGNTSSSITSGTDVKQGVNHVDFLELDKTNNYVVDCDISTANIAYIWHNTKGNVYAGAGPALSFCKIKQGKSRSDFVSDKNYVLPGVLFTGGWNFIDNDSWFLGIRTDIGFMTKAKTEEIKITNYFDNSFTSVSKSYGIGGLTGTILLSGGIKF